MMERTREHWPDHICRISFLHRLQWPPIAWPTSAHHGVAFVRTCHYTSYFFHSSQHSRTAKHPRDPLAWSWWVEQRNFWDEFGVNLQWRERLAVLNFFPHDIGWSNKHFIFVLLLITEAIQTWYQVFSPQHQTLNSSNLGFLFVGVYLWIKAILLFPPFGQRNILQNWHCGQTLNSLNLGFLFVDFCLWINALFLFPYQALKLSSSIKWQ